MMRWWKHNASWMFPLTEAFYRLAHREACRQDKETRRPRAPLPHKGSSDSSPISGWRPPCSYTPNPVCVFIPFVVQFTYSFYSQRISPTHALVSRPVYFLHMYSIHTHIYRLKDTNYPNRESHIIQLFSI